MNILPSSNTLPAVVLFLFFLSDPAIVLAQSVQELYEQAAQYFYDGKYDQAVRNYERILEMEPNFAPAYNALGLALKIRGAGVPEAEFYFKKAIELDPSFLASYDNLGKLYYSAGDMDQAEEYFKKGLAIDPQNESMKLSMGWIYLLGRNAPDQAMKYFKAVASKNNSVMGYFGEGICYMANQKRMEVMDIVTKLRQMGQEGLATDLETMLRENRSLVRGSELPTVTTIKTAPNAKNDDAAPAPAATSNNTSSASPVGEYDKNGELQIRLRDKLPVDQ